MQCSDIAFNSVCLSNTNVTNSELQSQNVFLILTGLHLELGIFLFIFFIIFFLWWKLESKLSSYSKKFWINIFQWNHCLCCLYAYLFLFIISEKFIPSMKKCL